MNYINPIKRILRNLPKIRLPFPSPERPKLQPEFIPVKTGNSPFPKR